MNSGLSITRAAVRVLATLVLVAAAVAGAQQPAHTGPTDVDLQAMHERAAELGLPEGVIQLTPCVPGMGEHWANPGEMPFGPIYGVLGDEVVFVEIMPSQAHFAQGESWLEVLMPLPGKAIDHVDFEFVPFGHEGYEVPHYDIHAYFVTHAEHTAFCPPAQ
jgi:hypothetical protein